MRTYDSLEPLHLSNHTTAGAVVDISAWKGNGHLTVGVASGPDFRRAIDITTELARELALALFEAANAIDRDVATDTALGLLNMPAGHDETVAALNEGELAYRSDPAGVLAALMSPAALTAALNAADELDS